MSETIDKIPFATDSEVDDEPGFREYEGEAPEPATRGPGGGAPGTKQVKPFPLMKILGGFGIVLVVGIIGAVVVGKAVRPKANDDQFGAVPQPAMTTQATGVPGSQNGAVPQGNQYGQAPGVYQQPPLPNGQPPNGPGMVAANGQYAQSMQPPMQQPQAQQAPGYPAPAAPAVNAMGNQPMAQQGMTQQGQAPAQMPLQQDAQADASTAAQASRYQPAQQGAQPPVNQAAQAPAPMAEPREQPQATQAPQTAPSTQPALAHHAGSAGAAGGDLAAQVAQLSAQVDALTKQLKQGEPSRTAKRTKSALPAKANANADAETSDDADAASSQDASTHTERASRAHGSKHRAAVKAGSGGKSPGQQDSNYVLTGMIGGRAFIAKRGSTDVNPDSTVVAGGTLDDGRKVIMVDPKQKRVYLSGGQYISADPASNQDTDGN